MARSRMFLTFFALAFAASGCDESDPGEAFDPSTVDYDAVTSTDFGDYVQPLLAARDVFAPAATTEPGDTADYTWEAIFDGEWGESMVPFDAEGSFLVRFVEDLPADAALPYPNLRRLEDDELRFLKRWIEGGAKNDGGDVPYADAEHVLYAAEQGQNSVALLDMERMRVIRRVYFDDLGVPSGQYGPHHMTFEPDGSAWFVSLVNGGADSRGRILKLSTSLTMDPSDPAYLLAESPPFTTPGMLALDPHSNRLYVGRSTLSDEGTSNLGVFDRAAMVPIGEVVTFDRPHALAITPDGQYVLTAALFGNVAATVRTSDLEVQLFPLEGPARELIHFSAGEAHHGAAAHAGHGDHAHSGAGPQHLAEATLTSRTTDEVLFFNVGEDGTLTPTGSAPAGNGPYHAHAGHDGGTLLIPNWVGNAVTLLDVETREIRTIENPPGGPLARPHSPAPGMDGTVFFVTSSNRPPGVMWSPTHRFLSGSPGDADRQPLPDEAFGNVAAFDAETGALVKTIQLGTYPSGLEHPMAHGGHGQGDRH